MGSTERMTMYIQYPILTTVVASQPGYDVVDCYSGTSKQPLYAIPLNDCQNKINVTWTNPAFPNRVCSEEMAVLLFQREIANCVVNGAMFIMDGCSDITFPVEISDCGNLNLFAGDPSEYINAVSCPMYISPDLLAFDLF